MARYKIWDREEEIITPYGNVYSKEQWLTQHPWARKAKMVISGGVINGALVLVFDEWKERCKRDGVPIEDGMTDEEVLAAIEAFEDTPKEAPVSAEERIAAALEFQVMLALPDEK